MGAIRFGRYLALGAACLLVCTSGARAERARRETLRYDDGEYAVVDSVVVGEAGSALAVAFQAPPWAVALVEVQYLFVGASREEAVVQRAAPFLVTVWSPDAGFLPEDPAVAVVNSGESYELGSWAPFALPAAVSLTDTEEFPDRTFFVGLQWVTDLAPAVGVDTGEGLIGVFNDGVSWQELTGGTGMIRAVVSDTLTVPVERQSWGRVKALYRD
jgi:hypothetical protein